MPAELIVALDLPDADAIPGILDNLPAQIQWYKVGLELFVSEGPGALAPLIERNKHVFLDLKLHDIPRTVANAVQAAARRQVRLLTVHAGGGRDMLKAAADAAAEAGPGRPKLLAVTALTSLNDHDMKDLGVGRPLADHALHLAEMAVSAGIDGLVCSPIELSRFRETLGDRPLIVTPGIRPTGTDLGDQKRVATPAGAVRAGADFLVVGRPILQAPDPAAAATEILRQMHG